MAAAAVERHGPDAVVHRQFVTTAQLAALYAPNLPFEEEKDES